MKIWIDDVRLPPQGYYWCKSVNEAIAFISFNQILYGTTKEDYHKIDLIDIDHDAGVYASDGGDYIKLLDWLEFVGYNYPIHIHSMNPVGVANMRAIIQKNGWKEV